MILTSFHSFTEFSFLVGNFHSLRVSFRGSPNLGRVPPPPTSPDLANAALCQLPRWPSNGPLATQSHPGISWVVGEGAMSQIWSVERPQKQKHASSTMLTAAEQRRWSLFKPCERHDATLYYRGIAYQSKAKRVL